MSRWFRHYAGMMRDEKLVRAAVKSKQPVERVVWVWGAILESAAEINDGGRFEFDAGEAGSFLGCDPADLLAIQDALATVHRVCGSRVVWQGFSTGEDRGRPPADVWRRLRDIVFRRDDFTCAYCGARGVNLECDHVVPVSRGGSHTLTNLITSCFACNRSKSDKLLSEWIR